MSPATPKNTCSEVAPLFVFYLCNEVDERERAKIEEHLANCEACRTQLSEERNFQDAMGVMVQAADELDTAGVLLSQCRSELAEHLDDLTRPRVKETPLRFAWLRRWLIVHPAWSGAALVAFGLVLGTQFSQWLPVRNAGNGMDQAIDVRPSLRLTDDQLSKMAVAGINWTPSTSSDKQNVRLQLSAEQPVVLTGSLDDTDVQRVLTYVVANGERFDPGVRLDCLDALKARARDAAVRSALLSAARKDQNPAVRLKALEALGDTSYDQAVRATLLQALQYDTNPGVRVEAVNLLVRSLQNSSEALVTMPAMPDKLVLSPGHAPQGMTPAVDRGSGDESMASVIHTLEDLQRRDPSRYVRLQSATALRQIAARNEK
jgi:HEAT repeats/Putative zinc-finger